MNTKQLIVFLSALILVCFSAVAFAELPHANNAAGAVYTMTNDPADNQVVIFERGADGMLTLAGTVSTEGMGSGGMLDPLGSQGALTLSQDHRWLLAVNAGSNEVSVFRVSPSGLTLADKVDSGGDFPVSIAAIHNMVYVLNAGTPNIAGFFLDYRGQLTQRNNATRSLGTGGFAQVGFDPNGSNLVVTDRDENEILVFSINRRGLPSMNPVTTMSNGIAPFGFIFDELGHLLVSEAGSGAVSSYKILRDDSLQLISPSVANNQIATCWIAGNAQGFVFTANTGSGTISAYSLQVWRFDHTLGKFGKGKVLLLDETAGFGTTPIDMGITESGRYLYALDPQGEGIDMYAIEADGSLTDLGTVPGDLSTFAQGIAVR